jgi:hypothetical protein
MLRDLPTPITGCEFFNFFADVFSVRSDIFDTLMTICWGSSDRCRFVAAWEEGPTSQDASVIQFSLKLFADRYQIGMINLSTMQDEEIAAMLAQKK